MRRALLALLALSSPVIAAEDPPETLLLREPTVSAAEVCFRYADDLWIAPRAGGAARRLTGSAGEESSPRFSPDGAWIAFTGQYEGNEDVYVIPSAGGTPRRLTWHPGDDLVQGWHPDGKRVLFLTGRDMGVRGMRPALVSLDGGMPEMTAIPKASRASFREDGLRIAYCPLRDGTRTWKRYRGGMTGPVWVFDPATLAVEEAPHVNATDTNPCWAGDAVWFTSDRGGLMNVYRWKPGTKEAEAVTAYREFGARDLSAGGGVLAFSREGAIHLLDPATKAVTRLRISCPGDGLAATPRWVEAKSSLRDADPAPNGKRALVEARGEIFSVPREHGDVRNLTNSPGAHDRSPAWSPDGERVAWLSDASGEYRLMVGDPLGRGEPKAHDLGGAGFYYGPRWSPDGKHVLFTDKGNRIAFVTIETGKVTDVSRAQGDLAYFEPGASWSPDSKWIAFEQRHAGTMYDRIALFELASGTVTTVTDGFASAFSPAFSRDGTLLWFAASVDGGAARFDLDLSASAAKRHVESLYAVVLQKSGKNPLAPRSDEGKDPAEEKKGEGTPGLDLEGIDQRILSMPGARGDFRGLRCTADRLLLLEDGADGATALKAYDLSKRTLEVLEAGVSEFRVSADGKSVLYARGGERGPSDFFLADASAKEPKRLDLDAARVRSDPAREWPQILREVWRIQRDYFYDASMHGVDWNGMWERWSRFLPHVRHREDLNFLLGEMMGELSCGHEYLWGGQKDPAPPGVAGGLLGADWEAAEGRWRLKRVYRGQNWNPGLRAPLTEPGVDAREGDFLVSVDGRPVTAADNLDRLFEGTADRRVEAAFSAKADGSAPRTSTVVPVGDEHLLRRLAWVEERRAIVDRLSGGRLAYVYMPDTGDGGLASFERDFYSQLDRRGLVLDERYNGGGKVADHVIAVLSRKVLCWWGTREGWVGRTPFGTLQGPKVMVVNESAGSGGDAMPWMFRRAGLGPLVGTRTWGGLVGISGYPPLLDGGYVTAASFGIVDLDGRWIVENEGVAPDHEVIETPANCAGGRDPQLEKAVELALEAMKTWKYDEVPALKPPAPR